MLFKSMEKASNGDRSATALATSSLSINMYARRPLRSRKTTNSTHPIASEVRVVTMIENTAPLELPLPSSFDTLTLKIRQPKR